VPGRGAHRVPLYRQLTMARSRRPRAERRARQRATDKTAAIAEKLFRLSPGGAPERPRDVMSAALVEAQAKSDPCPRCGGSLVLVEHAAVVVGGSRLREAKLRCSACGSARSLWFRIVPSSS
jgi:ribosomal protein S27AE